MKLDEDLDNEVRLAVYNCFVDHCRAPNVADIAEELDSGEDEIEESLHRLDDQHILVLMHGSVDIWMAMPFSSAPTAFRVTSGEKSWWANCIWDSLGIPALLRADATVHTNCAQGGEALTLTVKSGELERADGVAHFVVPVLRWWDDVGYT
ncbi:MAG: organomercurial lyase [Candidatus Zixiibacteriota bacterium]